MKTPREIDTAIAAEYHELDRANQKLAYNSSDMFSIAGARIAYRGRRRIHAHRDGREMMLAEAIEIARERVAYIESYVASHKVVEDDGWERTDWAEFDTAQGGAVHETRRALEAFPEREKRLAEVHRIESEIDALQERYTGWSRFFVVTSSAGHVHSSMHCHTCRPTTTYGWLPELSGKTEAEAVKELGPALCSVCFPSAPLDWQGGKLTKAQAEKRAA